MIKRIFIPERLNSFYVLQKRIAAFDIGLTEIYVTVVLAKGRTRIIERLISEPIITEGTLSSQERITETVKVVAHKLGVVDEITLAIASSQAIFKELTLPFTGNKVKMVVPFEVESLLPFALDSAAIDSIVTQEDIPDHKTTLMVAAVKKENISEWVALFKAAGLPLSRITVDMFELYGLYKMVAPITNEPHTTALIDFGYHTTRLAIITNGQLAYVRSLPQGIVAVAKKLTPLIALRPKKICNI